MFNFKKENAMNYNLALTKFFYLPFIIKLTRMQQFYCIYQSDEAIYKISTRSRAKSTIYVIFRSITIVASKPKCITVLAPASRISDPTFSYETVTKKKTKLYLVCALCTQKLLYHHRISSYRRLISFISFTTMHDYINNMKICLHCFLS